MKKIALFFVVLAALVFSGCTDKHICPVPENIVEYKYLKRPIPELPKKPVPQEYQTLMVEMNGAEYYVFPKKDGLTISNNWESYKIWSETNHQILLNLNKENK